MEFYPVPLTWTPTVTLKKPSLGTRDAVSLKKLLEANQIENALQLLTERSSDQRQRIRYYYPRHAYGGDYSKDLMADLILKAPDLEDLIKLLMADKWELLATEIRRQLAAQNDHIALEYLMRADLQADKDQLSTAHRDLFGTDITQLFPGLEDKRRPLGPFLAKMFSVERECRPEVKEYAQAAVEKLKKERMSKWLSTQTTQFVLIFATFDPAIVQEVMALYEENRVQKMEETVMAADLPSSYKKGLTAILSLMRNQPAFFARRMEEAMASFQRDRRDLLSLILLHSELDMTNIKEIFPAIFDVPLETRLQTVIQEMPPLYQMVLMNLVK